MFYERTTVVEQHHSTAQYFRRCDQLASNRCSAVQYLHRLTSTVLYRLGSRDCCISVARSTHPHPSFSFIHPSTLQYSGHATVFATHTFAALLIRSLMPLLVFIEFSSVSWLHHLLTPLTPFTLSLLPSREALLPHLPFLSPDSVAELFSNRLASPPSPLPRFLITEELRVITTTSTTAGSFLMSLLCLNV